MPDNELILEIIQQIEDAAKKVVLRFQVINNPNDFTNTATRMEKSKRNEGYYYTPLFRY